MATRYENLDYKVFLTDPALVATYTALLPAGTTAEGLFILAPAVAQVLFHAPVQDPHAPFQAPGITSEWFAAGNNFPLDQQQFTRKSGGWFGIGWLFGKTVTYTWVGSFVIAAAPMPGVVGTPDPISQRRWIEGFDTLSPAQFNGSRAASRHVNGHGLLGQAGVGAGPSHACNENAPGLAPTRSWERFYVRPCLYPTANENLWKATGSVESNTGLVLGITTLGQLTVSVSNNVGTLTLIGTAGAALELRRWYRIDVLMEFGATAKAQLWVDGVLSLNILSITPGTGMGTAGRTHSFSTLGGNSTGVLHYDDWMCAEWPPFLNGLDWVSGSHIQRLPVTGFDAGANNWTGNYRAALQSPSIDNGIAFLTSSVSAGRVGFLVDAEAVDVQAGALGVVAALWSVFSYKGNVLNGTITGSLQAGAVTFSGSPVESSSPTLGVAGVMYRPTGLTAALKLGVSSLVFTKGADTNAAKLATVHAVVEVIGIFGDEDRPAHQQAADALGPSLGPHNAPYPWSPWAQRGVAPQAPVVIHGGTYVGAGTGLDLLFRVPVHWLLIRPLTGDSGGVRWTSALLGAHYRTQVGCVPAYVAEAAISRTFVAGSVTETVSSGDHSDLVARVKTECVALGLDLSGDCGAFEITKRVAWQMKSTGGGLLDKPTGANCQGYATDIVCFSDGSIYDILVNAGTDNTPAWQVSGAGTVDPSRYRAPIDPGDDVPPTPDGAQVQQTVVRLAGSDGQVNAAGVTYQFIAFCDPGRRFCCNTVLDGHRVVTTLDTPLELPAYQAQAAFVQNESINATTFDAAFYKGPGTAANSMTSIDGTSGEIANALTLGIGLLTARAAFNSYALQQVALSLFRRDDTSGDPGVPRVVCIQTYTGDGSASRSIALLPPSARRPLFALCVPHNGAMSIYRDPSHTGTTSSQYNGTINAATGITGGNIDSLTVGSALNVNAVVYDLFVFFAGTDACNNGWGCNGEYIPVEPIAPPGPGPWAPPPPPPTPIVPPVPVPPPGGGPPWPTTQCSGPSLDVVNRAISRLGESILVTDLVTENIPAAIQARLHYVEALEATLRDFPWPFATRYVAPVLVAGTAAVPMNADWHYSYRAPADLLFARRFVKRTGEKRAYDGLPDSFRMGSDAVGPLIYTDLEPTDLLLEYTIRVTCAATQGTADFRSAFTWRLAHELATPLTRDKDLAKWAYGMYLQQIVMAETHAANESQQDQQSPDAPWITGRD